MGAPRLRTSALACAFAILGACRMPDQPTYLEERAYAYGHTHSSSCNHFRRDGVWYHLRQHRHGPGCGHVLRAGLWLSTE